MNIFEFIIRNPSQAFVFGVFILAALYIVASAVVDAYDKRCRSRNIQANGWPPAHCDADGTPNIL